MPLTDSKIRAERPPARLKKLTDGDGLYLLLTPNGGRLWRMQYRFAGKQKTLALGSYPEVSISDARVRHRAARTDVSNGQDPAERARLDKIARKIAATNTFGVIADEFVERLVREGKADATLQKTRWLLDIVRPSLAHRPISQISPAEVLAVLRTVEARGRLETAKRLRSTLSRVFRYAVATVRAERDPTQPLQGALIPPRPTPRAAITEPVKFGELLRAIEAFNGQPATHAALRLLPLVFSRPGELRAAAWHEFDFDSAVWTIPAERTKMRRPHRVPLAPQALQILQGLYPITGRGRLVFPCVRTTARPISENTLNAALRRLGFAQDEQTAHGFRATASTLLNESGLWNPDAIERQLAHLDRDDVRRVYARGEHWEERVRMMHWWADLLDELRQDLPSDHR